MGKLTPIAAGHGDLNDQRKAETPENSINKAREGDDDDARALRPCQAEDTQHHVECTVRNTLYLENNYSGVYNTAI